MYEYIKDTRTVEDLYIKRSNVFTEKYTEYFLSTQHALISIE